MPKNIILGICGGIAAYKSILLARLLLKAGHNVQCILTPAAKAFVTPLTLQALTGRAVRDDLFDTTAEQGMSHIELARWADLLIIAPSTANTLAKLSHGIADNLLTTVYLATTAQIIVVPAMNSMMWHHSATQENLAKLQARPRHVICSPDVGIQACGEVGEGRMMEPEDIMKKLSQLDLFGETAIAPQQAPAQDQKQPINTLQNQEQDNNVDKLPVSETIFVITAGPTSEPIDPVRCITNHSSGKMGYALAHAALKIGPSNTRVILISGPVSLPKPTDPRIQVIDVQTAQQMLDMCVQYAPHAHVFIGAAAVCDYRVKNPSQHKTKKQTNSDEPITIELVKNPDIIATIASWPVGYRPTKVIGFAAETQNVEEYAKTKLHAKKLDCIVANDVSNNVFGSDTNKVSIFSSNGSVLHSERLPKNDIADFILEHVL